METEFKMWRKKNPFEDYTVKEMRRIINLLRDKDKKIRWEGFWVFVKASECARSRPEELTLSERTYIYGHQNSLQTLIREGFFDCIQVQPWPENGPLIAFKKLGQDIPFIVFLDGRPQGNEWNSRIQKNAPEIPLKLFWSKNIRFTQTQLMKSVRNALKKLGVVSENRGGRTSLKSTPDESLEKLVVRYVKNWLLKKNDIPSARDVAMKLPIQYENLEESHINRYLKEAVPKAILEILDSRIK